RSEIGGLLAELASDEAIDHLVQRQEGTSLGRSDKHPRSGTDADCGCLCICTTPPHGQGHARSIESRPVAVLRPAYQGIERASEESALHHTALAESACTRS